MFRSRIPGRPHHQGREVRHRQYGRSGHTRIFATPHDGKADQKSDDELGPPLLTRRTDERDYLEREEHERQRAVPRSSAFLAATG